MLRTRLLLLFLLLSATVRGQSFTNVGNALQRSINPGVDTNWRFNTGSTGFFYPYSKWQSDSTAKANGGGQASNGIVSGLITTISGSNAITTAGSWRIAGILYSKGTSTTTALEAQDPTLFRQDILYATTSNTILKSVGVLGVSFTAPSIPPNTIPVANIFISPTSVTTTPVTTETYSLSKLTGYANNYTTFNSNALIQDNVVSWNGSKYVVFTNDSLHAVIERQTVPNGGWQVYYLSNIPGNPLGNTALDAHNTYSIGIDSLGYIHIAGNMHDTNLKAVKSTSPGDITSWTTDTMLGDTTEASVTYPRFFNDNGALFFYYRHGVSGNGNNYINRYNATTGTWRRVCQLTNGIADNVNFYENHIVVSPNHRIHISGVWRLTGDPTTNENVCYFYSDDYGVTWKQANGTPYTLPITIGTCAPFFANGTTNVGLINQTGMAVDSLNRPVIATFANDTHGNTQLIQFWYDTAWHGRFVTNFTSGIYPLGATLTSHLISRPSVFNVGSRDYLMYSQTFDKKTEQYGINCIDITPTDSVSNFQLLNADLGISEFTYDTNDLPNGNLSILLTHTPLESTYNQYNVGLYTIKTSDINKFKANTISIPNANIGYLSNAYNTQGNLYGNLTTSYIPEFNGTNLINSEISDSGSWPNINGANNIFLSATQAATKTLYFHNTNTGRFGLAFGSTSGSAVWAFQVDTLNRAAVGLAGTATLNAYLNLPAPSGATPSLRLLDGSDPSSVPARGSMWMNTALKLFRGSDGTSMRSFAFLDNAAFTGTFTAGTSTGVVHATSGLFSYSTIATADIANNAVTYGKMQAMTANKLLGSGLTGTAVSEITLGSGLSFTGTTLNATSSGGTVTSITPGYGFTSSTPITTSGTLTIDTSKLATIARFNGIVPTWAINRYQTLSNLETTLTNSATLYPSGSAVTAAISALGATPTALVGTTAITGTSPNFIHADGAPAINQAMVPTWTGNHTWSQAVGNSITNFTSTMFLANPTVATGTGTFVQPSPFFEWDGSGMGATVGLPVAMRMGIQPTYTGGNPQVKMVLQSNINNIGWVNNLIVDYAGDLYTQASGGVVGLSGSISTAVGQFGQGQTSLATNITPSVELFNSTTATSGVPVQNSPFMEQQGQAWQTGGTPASVQMFYWQGLKPISATIAGAKESFSFQTNSGSIVEVASLNNTGTFSASDVQLSVPTGVSAVLSSTSSINFLSTANTLLYTNSTGKTVVIDRADFVVTAATSVSAGPTVSLTVSTTADLMPSTALTALTASGKMFGYGNNGVSLVVPNGGTVTVNITSGTGTSETGTIKLIGETL